jgi:RimJ/RimL family protein N-acetyltransferase
MSLPTPTLHTARLRLRPFNDADANDLFALHTNAYPDYRSASLGYCFADAAWGHGYATEAARGLLRWAFDTLDLNRVQAQTDTRNVASARVLEKLGFVREGTLREDCVVNGEVSDSWVYGLIRREWRPSREPVPAR